MRLSNLQKYILLECFNNKLNKISRGRLKGFYDKIAKKPTANLMTKIITQSIERLINKGLLIGFGERTAQKWFIKEIKLTMLGKRQAKKLLGEQMVLPLRKHMNINTNPSASPRQVNTNIMRIRKKVY